MSDRPVYAPGEFSGLNDTPPARSDVDPLRVPASAPMPWWSFSEEGWMAVAVFGGVLAFEGVLPWATGGGVLVAYIFVAIIVLLASGVAGVAGWPRIALATGLNGAAAFLLLAYLGLDAPPAQLVGSVATGMVVGGLVLCLLGLVLYGQRSRAEDA